MFSLNSPATEKVGDMDAMSEGQVTPPPANPELDPPLLQLIDEDSLDVVLNPLAGEATLTGLPRGAAHKRFQVLGQELIRYTALRYLWDKYPMDRAVALQAKRDIFCSAHQLAIFAKLYKLTAQMQDVQLTVHDIEKTYAGIFEAYVGAATVEMSISRVYDWVYNVCKSYGEETQAMHEVGNVPLPSALAAPPHLAGAANGPSAPGNLPPEGWSAAQAFGLPQPAAVPGVKQEPQEYHPSMPLLPPRARPLPYHATQPHPYFNHANYRQTPVFQATTSKVSGSLAALRQKATQLRKEVSFTETSVGPDHQKQWTCALLVDHIEVGVGTASSKQVAKDLAAQQALMRLGWV